MRLEPAWLAWQGGLIPCLAEQVYENRQLPSGQLDLERLAVLADAMEEAGADANLVAHLRGSGPHVRGCFVVDMLMGNGVKPGSWNKRLHTPTPR